MSQTATLSKRATRHDARIRFVRTIFPIFALIFLLTWAAIGQYERVTLLQQLVSFLKKEFETARDGYVLTFTMLENGVITTRKAEFDQFNGTGLAGEPFNVKSLRLIMKRADRIEYEVVLEQGLIDPIKNELLAPGAFVISSLDKFKVTTSNAKINFYTFASQTDAPVSIVDDQGLRMSSQNGMLFNPDLNQFTLVGPTSVSINIH